MGPLMAHMMDNRGGKRHGVVLVSMFLRERNISERDWET